MLWCATFLFTATQLLENRPFQMVLEEDGSMLDKEVLEAVIQQQEQIVAIMFLQDGEAWSQGNTEWRVLVTGRIYTLQVPPINV